MFDHHALPWSPKCFTSVYIHKKIGDKRGKKGAEISPGSETHTLGADVNQDETQAVISCS